MYHGVFNTLEEVVHFYNTRDVPGAGWSKAANSGDPAAPGFEPWDRPEFPATMELKEVGNLGLTAAQERAIAAFLRTLSDRNPVTPPTVR